VGGIPRQVGGYEVLGLLGQGGMGSVYRGRDPRTGLEVAIKVLRRPERVTENQVRRFRREGRALARFQHPNVVRLIESGVLDGAPYLVTELVEGEDLEVLLRREGALDDVQVAELGLVLASALAASHAAGIVHRDLKPANVLLRPDGSPVLTDFGIAKDVDAVETARRLTATGVFIGTPGFWSPEQVRAEANSLGPWTDVYGLGATLYALRAGVPPFVGPLVEVLGATLEQPALPLCEHYGASRELSAIVQRCLAKEPADRYSSMTGLAEDLESLLDLALSAPGRTRAVRGLALSGAALSVLGGLLVALLWEGGGLEAEGSRSVASPTLARRTPAPPSLTPLAASSREPLASPAPAAAPAATPQASASPTPGPSGSRDRRFLGELLLSWDLPPGEPDQWSALAAKRDPRACLALGVAHWTGRGAALDLARAQNLLRLAADLGEPRAEYFVGEAHAVGKEAPLDQELAFKHMLRAALGGYARAQTAVGHCYRLGQGVEQDLSQAHRWFVAAADQDFPEALNSLGYCRQHGFGIPVDIEGSVALYRRAAALESATGMLNLGECYRTGAGVPRDTAEAMRWFEKAARAGNVLAMASLGHGYRDGLTGQVELDKARRWLKKAGDLGHHKARWSLQELEGR